MRNIIFTIFLFLIISCDDGEGLFGHSNTREEAKASGSTVIEYVPNKSKFKLLDGTEMQIDTAWTEVSFTFHNGKRVLDSSDGYHFSIPVRNDSLQNFMFEFYLLDSLNQVFTSPGADRNGLSQLCPRKLYNQMKIVLEQKNPDSTKHGWIDAINTDTITFHKINGSY
jgi:hypothetical protein